MGSTASTPSATASGCAAAAAPPCARPKRVLAFSGGLGSGKDFMAQQTARWLMARGYRPHVTAIAAKLKERCYSESRRPKPHAWLRALVMWLLWMFAYMGDGLGIWYERDAWLQRALDWTRDHRPLSFERLFVRKDAETRRLLQRVGLEHRQRFGDSVWIDLLDLQLQVDFACGVDVEIVTDLRFRSEKRYFEHERDDALCVRLEAPLRTLAKARSETDGDQAQIDAILSHVSERDLEQERFDVLVPNDPEHEPHALRDLLRALEPHFPPRALEKTVYVLPAEVE